MPQIAVGRKTKIAVTATFLAACAIGGAISKPWKRLGTFKHELLQRVRDPQWTFYAIDLDRDGYLDYDEVRNAVYSVLGRNSSDVSLNEIFAELDDDNDGYVSLDEFKQWWARTDEDDGFRRKLVRGLNQNPSAVSKRSSTWRTIRMRNGRDVRLIYENRRLLMQRKRLDAVNE
jgi:EF-hand domain pair